ncbi:hypothetical protein N658DRAFT_339941 [Parathielavia hyrcaniae]|uniref:Secreted protein n=1 Tax=Parathielavia hyrcaniae TaxID=113614 RepID=A0AAN6T2L8_9PEZI|nr:hypothetical protein N658DRAFT_339941 [Parathielavia hyrcaniae]
MHWMCWMWFIRVCQVCGEKEQTGPTGPKQGSHVNSLPRCECGPNAKNTTHPTLSLGWGNRAISSRRNSQPRLVASSHNSTQHSIHCCFWGPPNTLTCGLAVISLKSVDSSPRLPLYFQPTADSSLSRRPAATIATITAYSLPKASQLGS